MANRRTARVAEAIREVVSTTILVELRDPRIAHVTVLGVEVPEDLMTAKIRVSVLGEPRHQRRSLAGLQAARGFLQARLADQLQLRHTPILTFVLDQAVKKSAEASRVLRELADAVADAAVADAAVGAVDADTDAAPALDETRDDDSAEETKAAASSRRSAAPR